MKRTLLIAGLGITVLLSGSLVLVFLLTNEAPPEAEAPARVSAGPPVGASSLAPRAPPWAVAAARPTSVAQEWKTQVKDPSAPGMADRTTRKAVRKGLLAAPVAEELARCVDRDREVWFSGWDSPEPIPRAKPAILTLDLETVGSQVKVADARVKSWGGASRMAVACAREALIGRVVIPASLKAAKPKMQMTFLLNPTSRALVTAR